MPPESPQQPKKEIHPPLFIAILLVIAGLIGSFQVWQVLNPITRTPLKILSLEEIKNNAQCSDVVICPDDYKCIKTDNLPRANGICVSQFSDWETYRNAEYGVEFKYPSDWFVLGGSKQVPIIVSSTGKPGSGEEIIIENDHTYEIDQSSIYIDKINQIVSTFKFIK